MECTVAVAIDDFTLASLEDAAAAERTTQGVLLMRAIRYYLAERGSGRPGWRCSAIDEEGEAEEATSIEFDVEAVAWGVFSREAGRQGVSADSASAPRRALLPGGPR